MLNTQRVLNQEGQQVQGSSQGDSVTQVRLIEARLQVSASSHTFVTKRLSL